MKTRSGFHCDKLIKFMTLARGNVLNRALKHARQGTNFQIAPPTLSIAYRVPYVGEESFPGLTLVILCNEKLLEILSLFSNESSHGWAQYLHGLTVNPLLCKLILHRTL